MNQADKKAIQIHPYEKRMENIFAKLFRKQERMFMPLFEKLKTEFSESEIRDWEQMWDYVSFMTVSVYMDGIESAVKETFIVAGLTPPYPSAWPAFTLSNPGAVEYLDRYGARLVTGVNKTSKDRIASIISKGVDEGWSYKDVAKELKSKFADFAVSVPQRHLVSRAELIATTEINNAYEEANYLQSKALQSAGLPMEKSWLVTFGNICDMCLDNEAAGWIPLDAVFPSGHLRPLAHPGCKCTLLDRMAQ